MRYGSTKGYSPFGARMAIKQELEDFVHPAVEDFRRNFPDQVKNNSATWAALVTYRIALRAALRAMESADYGSPLNELLSTMTWHVENGGQLNDGHPTVEEVLATTEQALVDHGNG
jgi:hypothetical protein